MDRIKAIATGVATLVALAAVKYYGEMRNKCGYLEGAADTMKVFVEKDAEEAANKKED